jgi:hypothetical protein
MYEAVWPKKGDIMSKEKNKGQKAIKKAKQPKVKP